ncbi:hypothetical protein YB2330_000196 [Saitoella coloradoensis]
MVLNSNPIHNVSGTMDCWTPQQTVEIMTLASIKKSRMSVAKCFVSSMYGGMLLSFGCTFVLAVNASPWFATNAPGVLALIRALVFPVGLIMIVLTGADLLTSNIMLMVIGVLRRKVTLWQLCVNWVVSFFGNLAGSLFFMAIIVHYGNIFHTPAQISATATFGNQKVLDPAWHEIFLRGIACNWLVCLAVILGTMSREVISKMAGIEFPTATFIACGFDHVVANFFFIPTAMWAGADFGVGYYIWKSLIPSLLGNIVGGGVFCGAGYWYLYVHDEEMPDYRGENVLEGAEVSELGGPTGLGPFKKDRENSEFTLRNGHHASMDQSRRPEEMV